MRRSKYWIDRQIDEMLIAEKSALDYETRMLEVYKQSLIEIQKSIEAFYNRYARANHITYAEARKRLDAKEFKDFQVLIRKWRSESGDMSSEYQKYLEALSKRKYVTRMESLMADIRYQIELLELDKVSGVYSLLESNYISTHYAQIYNIAQLSELPVLFHVVDTQNMQTAIKSKWAQNSFSGSIWKDRDALIRNLETIIPQSFARGLNSNQLGDMLAKEMNTSKNRARTLVRTEVNRICNSTTLEIYKSTGVTEYQYLATLDMRTSDICRSLDLRIFLVSESQVGINYPPMHPNCRSTTVPYLQGLEDDLERVARDSEGRTIRVPRRMTQEEYINKYVPEKDRERLLKFRKKYPLQSS